MEDFEGGVKVTFIVVERPFVRDVQFAGNKKLDTVTLTEKIDLKLGAVYNPVEVTRAAEKLKDFYEEEGYFEVQVTPDATKLPDGDVAVTFRIAEGRKITIEEIVIEGAKGVTPKQVKAVMATQERQFYILRGTVERQKLDDDRDRIVSFYNDHGYIQARVESADAIVDKERARVTIRIVVVEGPQFLVGGVDITGNNVVPVEEIRRRIPFKTGDVFSRGKVRDSVANIQALYGTIGRASADVNPQSIQDTPNRRINITYEINEGPEVFVERINITGNTRSQEKILRREIPMHEGDFYTSAKLERARQRLNNLGYFEQVKATTAPGSAKDKIIVNIEVTERPTGLFSIGGGYSSADSFIATLDLSQRNFLGRGWELFLRVRAGAETQQGTIGFTEPWLFDRPLSAGFDLFNNRRIFDDYTVNSLGGDIRFGHPLGDYSRWNLIYRVSQDDVSDVADNASTSLKSEEGKRITALVGGSVSRDTRDSAFEPTRGSDHERRGGRGGVGVRGQQVRARARQRRHLLQPLAGSRGQRARAGRLHGRLVDGSGAPVRAFLSGRRQFPPRVQGAPGLARGRVGNPGGRHHPGSWGTWNTRCRCSSASAAAVFLDIGQVYGPDTSFGTKFDLGDLRYNAGLSLRWASPFGPLRIDYGVKLDRRKNESFGEFQFSVGAPF